MAGSAVRLPPVWNTLLLVSIAPPGNCLGSVPIPEAAWPLPCARLKDGSAQPSRRMLLAGGVAGPPTPGGTSLANLRCVSVSSGDFAGAAFRISRFKTRPSGAPTHFPVGRLQLGRLGRAPLPRGGFALRGLLNSAATFRIKSATWSDIFFANTRAMRHPRRLYGILLLLRGRG
jgi:hypothetical protein